MEEHLANEYSYKKSLGGLLLDRCSSRLNAALQPVDLSFADEKYLTVGDTIMIKHCMSGSNSLEQILLSYCISMLC